MRFLRSWFYTPTPDKTLYLSPAIYLGEKINGSSYHDYFATGRFKKEGYAKIFLNNFNFTPVLSYS